MGLVKGILWQLKRVWVDDKVHEFWTSEKKTVNLTEILYDIKGPT